MQLSTQDIQKFQSVYRKKFGENLEFSKAKNQAYKLINLMRTIYRPIPKNYYEQYNAKSI